jgi:hypothetical protein
VACKLPGIKSKFEGFDRNPYLATFSAGPHKLSFLFVNVHLYWGPQKPSPKKKASMERRSLETYAVALRGA